MSTTYDSLDRAYFPSEYADIVMDVLAITPNNLLSVKDILYHFRQLDDEQAAEVLDHIADRIETAQPGPTATVVSELFAALVRAEHLMRRVNQGDHHALEKLADASQQAGAVIAKAMPLIVKEA